MLTKTHTSLVLIIVALLTLTAMTIVPMNAQATTWSTPVRVDSGGDYVISLALDASGNPHVSYTSSSGALKYAYKDATGWHTETAGSENGDYVSLALDASGNPHISYENGDLKYAYKDATGWHTETVASDYNPDYGYSNYKDTSIALDASGNPHISYCNETNTVGNLKYAYRSTDYLGRPVWNTETVDTPASSATNAFLGVSSSLKLDKSGNPHISYLGQGPDYNLTYASHDATGWHTETVDRAGENSGIDASTSLALDASGNPHISYYDAVHCGLKYASHDATGWHTETVDHGSGCLFYWYISLALDASGNPHISYYNDGLYDDLQYAHKDAAGWHTETVAGANAGEGPTGLHNSIALDARGNPRISYYDSANGVFMYIEGRPDTATFTISTTTATPTTSVPFTLAGTLKSGTTSLKNQPVHLERRTYANEVWGGWANVAGTYTYTDGTGVVKLSQTVAATGLYQYRWHFNGTTAYPQVFSSALTETVKKPTAFTITTTTATPTTNVAFTLSGTLKSGTTALKSTPVHLERRTYANGAWGGWANIAGTYKYTDGTGVIKLSQTVSTVGAYQYRWHYNGTATYQPAYSLTMTETVKKPTTLTLTRSPWTPTFNKAFTISGTLKTGTTGLVGYNIHLERKIGTGAWGDVAGTTKTTTTGGVIPSVSQTMTTHNTYSYRWHFTGTGTYQAGYSPVKTFTV